MVNSLWPEIFHLENMEKQTMFTGKGHLTDKTLGGGDEILEQVARKVYKKKSSFTPRWVAKCLIGKSRLQFGKRDKFHLMANIKLIITSICLVDNTGTHWAWCVNNLLRPLMTNQVRSEEEEPSKSLVGADQNN